MQSQSLGAGKEVLCMCGKCNLKLAHLIVTMKDPKTPGRVQCKTCQSTHLFKDVSMTTTSNINRKRTLTSKKSTKKDTRSNEEIWSSAINNSKTSSSVRPYSITENFIVGDIIEHLNFGKGIVQNIVTKEKIEVVFQDNVKTLVHNK